MIPYLLVSPDQENTEKYIRDFIAEHHYPAHAVQSITPLKKELGIDQIRDIQREVSIASMNRLFVIYEFQTASVEAQNSFLKTLEEKTEHNHFILVSNSETAVLPTIRSRVKLIKLSPSSVEQNVSSVDVTELMKDFQKKDISELLGDPLLMGVSVEKAIPLLDGLIFYFRELTFAADKKVLIMKKILETKRLVITNNINAQLAVDSIFLFIKKVS